MVVDYVPRVSLCLMRWGTKSQSVRPDVVDSEEAMQNSTTMHNKCFGICTAKFSMGQHGPELEFAFSRN
jgi:hypothetical protein